MRKDVCDEHKCEQSASVRYKIDTEEISHNSVRFDDISSICSCSSRDTSMCPHRSTISGNSMLRSELSFSIGLPVICEETIGRKEWSAFVIGCRETSKKVTWIVERVFDRPGLEPE